ncbi:unnamed protein product [Fraxinus pennsylvanica]|uniref:DUF4378 domain-containing protein n=1 Tax=Fraxinus pennsylvanica TaxID=56036 RepID=A0AAD1YL02_9LAMI|nr:unnamed protein product [Fraxinus pennsylvanica]
MCAKALPSFTDEDQDLRKQIGCMNGIFQLFDRHHFPTRRRISSQNHKRLLPGAHHHNMNPRHATETVKGKDLEEARKESRISFESSRASCSSSSCSSMLSSSDSNKMAQPEAISFIPKKNRETPHQTTAMKEQNTSFATGQQSLDLRDVVKDSMYRETRGLSIKSKAKDERRGSVLKHIDSPRPSQQFKTGQSWVAVSNGSIQDLGKLQEITQKYKDERPALPRFSYDERESRDTLNSTIQRKELPRLSLDSRASTVKSSALQSRSNFLLRDLHIGNENSSQVLPSNQEPGSNKRSSNVVAKLMGLEAFSDVISTSESRIIKIKSCADIDSVSRSPKPAGMGKHTQDSCSPRVLQKDPASSNLGNANSVMKLTSCSRFPPEPAPGRQPNTSQGSRKQALKNRKSSAMTPNMSSVYGEIEKRITEIEFPKSDKDLAALKHILEAMEKTRQRLENRKGDLTESACQTSRYSVENIISDLDFRLSKRQDQRINHQVPTVKGTIPPKTSIMIMKPAKAFDKIKISSSSSVPAPDTWHLQKLRTRDSTHNRESSVQKNPGKDFTPRNNLKDPSWHIHSTDKNINWRTSEVQQTSKPPQCIKIESRATSGRSSGMASSRLKQKKQQSHPTTPPSDSGMIKKKCNKQVVASGHSNRKLHLKSTNLQHSYDQLNERSGDTRYSSHQSDTASVMSESNISLVSQIETEVVSLAHSIEMNAKQNQEPIHRNSAARLREDTITAELATTILEQPSPVSVLDAAFCRDDSPSPVKKISTAFRGDESPNFDEAEWHVENLNGLPDHKRFHGHSRRKLDMIEDLVHKLRLLNPTPYVDTLDHNTFMYESSNPVLQYITKILLASGLLRDVIPVPTVNQHHSSYHLINPDLFDVLEQTEQNMKLENEELDDKNAWLKFNQKIHRRIVFDTVNEILVHKFASRGLFTLGREKLNQEELPKEIHLELNRLQRKQYCSQDDEDDGFVRILKEDMMHQSADWAESTCEIPALVLDIERLIFKDLINEAVMREAIGPAQLTKEALLSCRELFTIERLPFFPMTCNGIPSNLNVERIRTWNEGGYGRRYTPIGGEGPNQSARGGAGTPPGAERQPVDAAARGNE